MDKVKNIIVCAVNIILPLLLINIISSVYLAINKSIKTFEIDPFIQFPIWILLGAAAFIVILIIIRINRKNNSLLALIGLIIALLLLFINVVGWYNNPFLHEFVKTVYYALYISFPAIGAFMAGYLYIIVEWFRRRKKQNTEAK